MGRMKDLLITVHNGGDDAVEAVQRIGEDWRLQLEAAAGEVERLKSQIKLLDAAHAASHSGFMVMASGLENAAAEVQRLRLTDAEREAVERAIATLDGWKLQPRDAGDAATLRGLLERTK